MQSLYNIYWLAVILARAMSRAIGESLSICVKLLLWAWRERRAP